MSLEIAPRQKYFFAIASQIDSLQRLYTHAGFIVDGSVVELAVHEYRYREITTKLAYWSES